MFSSGSKRLGLAAGALLVPAVLLGSLDTAPGSAPARNRYIGAMACKNCHKADEAGNQFKKWEESKHSQAWKLLATPEAKEVGKKHGVDNPQKSDKCLKCHVTAYGESKRELKRGFDPHLGVQCESCHGPGERHAKARFKAASEATSNKGPMAVPDGEIIKVPGPKACMTCHQKESPTFKPFCYKERVAKIEHLDPRKKRTEKELAARKCQCGDDCKCVQSECSMPKDGAESGKEKAKK